jgi:hypothetical protein
MAEAQSDRYTESIIDIDKPSFYHLSLTTWRSSTGKREDFAVNEIPPDGNKRSSARLPRPRAFHMTDPFRESGLWCFWLTADDEILEFVRTLNCVLDPSSESVFRRQARGRVLFAINPRYDHEEAWLWITEILHSETQKVELNQRWENAIDNAHETELDD